MIMRTIRNRRFIVNQRTHNELNNRSNNKCLCILVIFIAIVFILVIAVVYFAVTFPLIENIQNKDESEFLEKINQHLIIGKGNNEINEIEIDIDIDIGGGRHNDVRESILIRVEYESVIQLEATPFLVGLGAEKSGSTSLGAAMFNSGEFSCPNNDEIDVETKYWSDCFKWDIWDNDNNKLQNKVNIGQDGHCSIKQYQKWQKWRNGKYKFEKSVDYLGLPYITRIFSDIFVKKHGTKIFVMIRYPPPRISSTWKFFVGTEKDNMPNQYGNVELFTTHLLQNSLLTELINLLKDSNNNTNTNIFELDWKNTILPTWNKYMLSLEAQCIAEAPIAGFKSEYCNPSQLLRRAVGLSCYIIPIMQWIIDLGIENAINSFRIIQSELYFKNGKDIMDRLICWSKQGTVDVNKCDLKQLYQTGAIKIKKLQGTIKSETNDFSDELIEQLNNMFAPCNNRLFQLLTLYPQLALKEFVWEDWHFKPNSELN